MLNYKDSKVKERRSAIRRNAVNEIYTGATEEFSVAITYRNESDQPLYVVDRANLPILVHPENIKRSPGVFTIFKTFTFTGRRAITDAKVAIASSISQYIDTASGLNAIYQELEASTTVNNAQSFTRVVISHQVNIKESLVGGEVYLSDIDILITDVTHVLDRPHPYSEAAKIAQDFGDIAINRKVSGVFVELIDNNSEVAKRYMLIAKQLMEIPAQQDFSRESGLYVSKLIYGGCGEVHVNPEFTTFEEAEEKFGIYKTKEEATSAGNPEALLRVEESDLRKELLEKSHASQTELIELKRRVENQRAAMEQESLERKRRAAIEETERTLVREQEKHRLDMERFENEALRQKREDEAAERRRVLELERIEHEALRLKWREEAEQRSKELKLVNIKQEKKKQKRADKADRKKRKYELEQYNLDRERQERADHIDRLSKEREDYYKSRAYHRDDYYDERSKGRKDSSEFIKWIPAIITGVAGIATATYLLADRKH